MKQLFAKYLSKALAVAVFFLSSYLCFAFAAWSIDFREWHWILRAALLVISVAPFTKQNFVKV